jgi:hypothetical protein
MQANIQVVTRLLNKAVSDEVGDERGEASVDALQGAFDNLDVIADHVRDEIAKNI